MPSDSAYWRMVDFGDVVELAIQFSPMEVILRKRRNATKPLREPTSVEILLPIVRGGRSPTCEVRPAGAVRDGRAPDAPGPEDKTCAHTCVVTRHKTTPTS